MTRPRFWLLPAASAAAWIAIGIDSLVRPDAYHYRDALLLVPWLLSLATFIRVHQLQSETAGRLERWGFGFVVIAMAGAAVGQFGILGDITPLEILALLSLVLWIVSMVAFGAGTIRAAVFPPIVGWAIVLSEPGAILLGLALSPIAPLHDHGSYTGGISNGLAQAIIACYLWRLAAPRSWVSRTALEPATA